MEWIIGIIVGIVVGMLGGGAWGWFVQGFRAKSRLATQAAEHQAAIATIQAEHDKAIADVQTTHLAETAGLDAQIAGLNGQLERLPLEHQESVTRLGADHSGKVAELQAGHQRELARLNEQLATLPLEHQAAIIKLRAEHDEKVAELQTGHQAELAGLNEKIADLNGQMEQVANAAQMLETAKAQFSETAKLMAADALQSNNQQFLELAKENFGTTLETAQRELDQRHQKFQELVKPLSDQYSQLTETFQTTATSALQNNSKQFLELAQENWGKTLETARSEFSLRHQQFQELVKPLSEGYTQLNPQIATLTTQVGAITSETAKLASALKGDNRAVGNWGELQLHRVVELAGMTDYCDFAEQQTTGSSQDRPDLVVRLPEQRSIVVDAKASTAAYLEISQAPDEETAQAAYARHAAALRRQVDSLAGKNYGAKEANSLDFVVMFVPGDQFLSAALNANPELINYAMSRRIAIATPASLIAMLWAIASGWQQFRLAEDAAKVKEAGEEMHKRMLAFINHYQNVGRRLDSAVDAYNRSIGSFDRSVVPQGRRFAGLVVSDDDDFPALDTLDETARTSAYATDPSGGIAAQAA